MLNIYYSREDIDRDRFIFDSVRGKTLLLVPDQFTLQAEKDAFFYLKAGGLMDLQAVSFSRLGLKVLQQTGGGKKAMIDKHGRQMLLAKILMEKKDDLTIYRGLERKNSFIEMTNNFISELKQYNTEPGRIAEIAEELPEHTFLKQKLTDIHMIYENYEEQISGKYIDTEDLVSLYAQKIAQAPLVTESEIWVYGFDSFTPKNRQVLGQLMKYAKQVNVVMTWCSGGRDRDLFQVTETMISLLCRMADEQGISWQKAEISGKYRRQRMPKAVEFLERELFALPAGQSGETEGLELVEAANFYGEAESAAAKVLSLVRDRKMAYSDILLICNDLETRGSIIKRVFAEYGMELFVDKKRSILHSPAAGYILALLDIEEKGCRTEDILRLLKTGFTDLTGEQAEELENYAFCCRIRGALWKKPFFRGRSEYSPEEFEELEASRRQLMDFLEEFGSGFSAADSVREKVRFLYDFLVNRSRLPERIQALIDRQEEGGYLDAAGETAQVWGLIIDVLDQFVEVVGEEENLAQGFGKILRAGLESAELSVLPPAADGLVLGTMQRTRSGGVKAMLVLGANEGVLPAAPSSESILSEDEKQFLLEKDIQICKIDELRQQEEKLAIYKSLTRPAELLWISYAASDIEGKEAKPSEIYSKIRDLFPEIEAKPDIANRTEDLERIQAKNRTLGYLTEAIRRETERDRLPGIWKSALRWYAENGGLDTVKSGLLFTNAQQKLDKKLTEHLYKKDIEGALSLSPSRLERYSRCPFSHLIAYGLRPEERRVLEVGSREIGELYHTCLMSLSQYLTRDGIPLNAPESPWMTVTREECRQQIAETIRREAPSYRGGVLADGQEAVYRTERLGEICGEMGWILVDHVRRGKIKSVEFEVPFGRGRVIKPIEVNIGGETVLIEGKIDRMDILADDRVKIIDYKTGREKFDLQQAKKGFKLQLMLYLKAAQEQQREPAGVFYFLISEPSVDASDIPPEELGEKVEAAARKGCKLEGVMVNEPEVIDSIAGDFSGYSDIVQIKKNKQGVVSGTTAERLLEPEEFAELQEQVDLKISELCRALTDGTIDIRPKKSKELSACTYCQFKGICRFDQTFSGCRYEPV